MQIHFDSLATNEKEVRAFIAFLSGLLPSPVSTTVNNFSNVPASQTAIVTTAPSAEVPVKPEETEQATPVESGAAAAEPVSITAPAKRGRRSKAEIEAANAQAVAEREPTTGDRLAAAEAQRKATAEAERKAAAEPGPAAEATITTGTKAVNADELRSLLNSFIARHSMEEAIGKLREFGCNRVTEALALEPAKLGALAAELNG